jgi:uncharacterized damage-inducible protein DinB
VAIKDGLLVEFDHEMATTRKLLERVPDDQLGWKPHEKSRSVGEIAAHLGQITRWASHILNNPSFNLEELSSTDEAHATRVAILTAFDAAAKQTRPCLDQSDTELTRMWSLLRGGREVFSMPRASAFRAFVLYHLVHHRGQLSVYLRLLDIAVPAIYGPSADEG